MPKFTTLGLAPEVPPQARARRRMSPALIALLVVLGATIIVIVAVVTHT